MQPHGGCKPLTARVLMRRRCATMRDEGPQREHGPAGLLHQRGSVPQRRILPRRQRRLRPSVRIRGAADAGMHTATRGASVQVLTGQQCALVA